MRGGKGGGTSTPEVDYSCVEGGGAEVRGSALEESNRDGPEEQSATNRGS